MFEGLKHYLDMRKALRHRERRRCEFERDINIARQKKDHDEMESLRNYQHMELQFADEEIDLDNSDHLIARAHRYLVPLPQGEEFWDRSEAYGRGYLTRKGAAQVRADIRAEKKAMWDYWQARVTLALALIGSIFGVLAFFKK
jgi:hypothetical protein